MRIFEPFHFVQIRNYFSSIEAQEIPAGVTNHSIIVHDSTLSTVALWTEASIMASPKLT